MVEALQPEQIERVFAPKLDAAWHLHELTTELDLSAFVLFSSMAGTLGGPGQANYAAANAFLDALARHRQGEDLPAVSMAWGLWARESGMTAGLSEADRARLRRVGAAALTDEQGLALFDAALLSGRPLAVTARVDRAALRTLAEAGLVPPVLRTLVPRRSARRAGPSELLTDKLATLAPEEHEAATLELVLGEVAAVLGHSSAEEVAADRPFKELGFDSLAAVELRNRLSLAAGLRLPATVVFDYPTAAALAGYLLREIGEKEQAGAEAEPLGRLEAALGAISAEDSRRQGFAAHLRALAADLEGAADGGEDSEADRLQSASDEELLEFIDEQVGG